MSPAPPYGLAAGLWTADLGTAHRVSRALRAGTVWVNCYKGGDMNVPFGGVKLSGFWHDKSRHTLEYTDLKTTWIRMPDPRPLIALPARFSASASALRYRAEVVAAALTECVFEAGGEPLVVHPGSESDSDAAIAGRLRWTDGVLLPGVGDLSPHWAGQEQHPSLYDVDLRQDAFDLAVARVVLATDLPVLAVCRGLQVVNVLLGGDVVQDMDETVGHHRHRRHRVSLARGSRMADVVGSRPLEVSYYHHQCLGRLGDGLQVVGVAEDGVVEAVELPERSGWFAGTQWHPEDTVLDDPPQLGLFQAFVDAARVSAVRSM